MSWLSWYIRQWLYGSQGKCTRNYQIFFTWIKVYRIFGTNLLKQTNNSKLYFWFVRKIFSLFTFFQKIYHSAIFFFKLKLIFKWANFHRNDYFQVLLINILPRKCSKFFCKQRFLVSLCTFLDGSYHSNCLQLYAVILCHWFINNLWINKWLNLYLMEFWEN